MAYAVCLCGWRNCSNKEEKMSKKSILLFDGVCNLCNGVVQFVIKRDKNDKFIFGALQSDAGQSLLKKHGLPIDDFESFILVENNTVYKKSTAALRVAKKMGSGWQLLYAFIIVPRFVRDFVYRLVANSRYRFFGKKDNCIVPTAALKAKFLK